ncbi:NAD-dependent epimerase/dehydratase family protein [Halobaculum sp. EA56]|uniref:NAD-dependent epimerase/dehydratase family protein n=1 Tax=Halobaculum sp. EA56 TaxID=3421648 RepID=UPI003EC0A098
MKEFTDKTVLVTGGAGFIGSHIADRLTGIADVRVLDNFSTGDPANVPTDATVIEGSITDVDAVTRAIDGVDVVFHEAAQTSVARSVEEPRRSHSTNVDGTLTVLDAAREANARTVLASSAAVYGHPERVPIRETDELSPTSPYGIDKLAVDHYGRTYADLYDQEVVALRYFNVYGPRGVTSDYAGVISVFLDQIRDGGPITVHGDGTQTRDFVHIDDVVDANLQAAKTDAVGEAFNVGTGDSVTIAELAEICREVTDSDVDIIHTDPREGDIDESQAEISKARAKLGYEPTVSLHDGLSRLVADRS